MIHVPRVTQLVHQQIAHDRRTQEQQTHIQADRPARRTAAPAGALPANLRARVTKPAFLAYLGELSAELLTRKIGEPTTQQHSSRAIVMQRASDSQHIFANDS